MRGKLFLFGIFIIIFCSVSCVSAANETADIHNDIIVSGNYFDDIQANIDFSSDNDTLILNGDYKSRGKSINISKSLNFKGENNATLDAGKISGIFNVTKNINLTFNNVNFINSNASAIFVEIIDSYDGSNSKVILNNCKFINNYGIDGAIYIRECEVYNCIFINNKALGDPNDFNSWGGAINTRNCIVNNSKFINNFAYSNGGAILSESGLITNCNFIDNYAGWEGGAFEITDVSVKNCNFTNNKADRYGGAIYSSEADILNCNFINNSVNNSGGAINSYRISIQDSVFENNTAIYGGAIYSTNLKINNVLFKNNHEAAIVSSRTTIDYKTIYSKFTSLDNSLKPFNLININAKSMKTTYLSGDNLNIVFSTTENNRLASYFSFLIIIKKDKYEYSDYAETDFKGLYSYPVSKLSPATYSFEIHSGYGDEVYTAPFILKTITITVLKINTIIKAPKVTNKYKRAKYFKVTVKNKNTNKAIKYLKIKLKIYTGKKYKIYNIKTDKKGVAKFKTNKLKKGNHKVVISSGSSIYKISKTSLIKIN